MSEDLLTRRFRRDLPGASDEARVRMRSTVQRQLEGRPEPPRQGSRAIGALGVTGALAAGVAFFALALPRGEEAVRPSGAPAPRFGVLEQGTPFDLSRTKLTPDNLYFPGVQTGSLRLSRTLPVGTRVVVGRASNDFVCLFLIPPRTLHRSGNCAPPRDVGVAALVQFASWGKRQTVVLVPDGVRVLDGAGRPLAARNNTVVFDRFVRRVETITPDGVRRVLQPDPGTNTLPMRPQDAAALSPVVPDLTGLTPRDAATVLFAARLADGPLDARPVADTAPNTVIGQTLQPGSTARARTEIGMVLAAPAGPTGERTALPAGLSFRWAGTPEDALRANFEDRAASSLRGVVRVLVFPASPAQAAAVRWAFNEPYTRVTVVTERAGATARRLPAGYPASLIDDPQGSLAAAVGVTRRPSVAVLDRAGRVAFLTPGLPTEQGRGGAGDLVPILDVLNQEPFPAGSAPSAPAGIWYLQDRPPLPEDQVPTFIRRGVGGCSVYPDRVWQFGPTAGGWRAWVAMTPDDRNANGIDLALITSRGAPVGSQTGSASGCGVGPDYAAKIRNRPVAGLINWGAGGGRTTSLWVVRPGYTEAVTPNGQTWKVTDGLLAITHRDDTPQFTLRGPAGTRSVSGR